jgi:phosphoglycerate dehydrogenase-like enzyme
MPHLLAESDVVVLCAPATAETKDLIDRAALARMKPGAVLCNVARGALVDEDALIRALGSGHLAAAILDVTRREPLPKDDPLWAAPNLYLSPHSSIPPDAYDERLLALFARNLRAYANGSPLENLVE